MIHLTLRLAIILFLLSITHVAAQEAWKYPTHPEGFLSQLIAQMNYVGGRGVDVNLPDGKSISVAEELKIFKQFWQEGMFSGLEDPIIQVVNAMVRRRMRWIPDIAQLIGTLNTAVRLGVRKEAIQRWLEYMVRELNNPHNRSLHIRTIYRFAHGLLIYNALIWRQGYQWMLSTENYEWGADSSHAIYVGPVDLLGISSSDTIIIESIEGRYNPFTHIFEGSGGRVTWRQLGIPSDELHAQLPSRYTIDLAKSTLTFDSATLYYPARLPDPMQGQVKLKIHLRGSVKQRNYPRFISYQGQLFLRDIAPGIHYEGGFGLEGIRILGIAPPGRLARVWIEKNGQKAIEFRSKHFSFRPTAISAQQSEAVIYWDDDSIVHSNVAVKIFLDKRFVSFNLQGQGDFHPPLLDFYHNLIIRGRYMEWYIDSPHIEIQSLYGAIRKVDFRSINYFNAHDYDLLRGILPYDPLHRLVLMARRRQRYNFDIEEVAIEFGNETRYGIIPLLITMANEGLIEYSTSDSTITILPRALDLVDAYRGKIDHDNIRLYSQVRRGRNAMLNRRSHNLIVWGVPRIEISDSQNVTLYPDREIYVGQRLSILFSGSYDAALMSFRGDSFYFNYDSFYVYMPRIDSATFFYIDTLPSGKSIYRPVKTPLQDLEGTLYIDSPNNKSGLQNNPQYPIFRSRQGGFVYYDDSTIGEGGYSRDSVYFELYPFVLDSLKSIDRQSFGMKGKFTSGGILPPFETHLKLMNDYSLGFEYQVPEEGMPLYGGKGHGQLHITMDQQGLKGAGQIEYLGARIVSSQLLFTPSYTKGVADTFYVAHNTRGRYPLVRGNLFDIQWYPQNDSLVLLPTKEHPAYVYEDSIQLVGRLLMTPEQMTSFGSFIYERGEVTAYDYFQLEPDRVFSPAADFRIRTLRPGEYAMESRNVSITLNLDKKAAHAITNTDTSITIFPYNQFITTLHSYTWDLKQGQIIFDVRGTADTTTALFISTAPHADSLTINSSYALYDIDNFQIKAFNIRYIEVNNSWVIPNNGKVIIEKGGRLPHLDSATIIADHHHKYHRIVNAQLTIRGKYDIAGTGTYPYQTISGDHYNLPANRIYISRDSLLRADITVPDSIHFFPHPRFQFTGTLKMASNDPALMFEGFIRNASQWPHFQTLWFPIRGNIDARNVEIPIVSPVNSKDGLGIRHGFFLEPGMMSHIYPRFLQPLNNDFDIPLATVDTAKFFYDSAQQLFIISDVRYDTFQPTIDTFYSYRLEGDERTGDIRVLSSHLRILQPAPSVTPYIGGWIQRDSILPNQYRLDLVAAFELPLPTDLISAIGDSAAENSFEVEASSDNTPLMHFCLQNWLAIERPDIYEDLIGSLEEEALWVPHKDYAPTFIFSDLSMMWNPELGMFISIDTPGLAGMARSGISQKVYGFVAIRPPNIDPTQPDQALYIYLEMSDWSWLFVQVVGKEVGIASSDIQLMETYDKKIRKMSQRGVRVRVLDYSEKDFIVGQILPIVQSYYQRY